MAPLALDVHGGRVYVLTFGPWIQGDLLERVFPAQGVDAPTRMATES